MNPNNIQQSNKRSDNLKSAVAKQKNGHNKAGTIGQSGKTHTTNGLLPTPTTATCNPIASQSHQAITNTSVQPEQAIMTHRDRPQNRLQHNIPNLDNGILTIPYNNQNHHQNRFSTVFQPCNYEITQKQSVLVNSNTLSSTLLTNDCNYRGNMPYIDCEYHAPDFLPFPQNQAYLKESPALRHDVRHSKTANRVNQFQKVTKVPQEKSNAGFFKKEEKKKNLQSVTNKLRVSLTINKSFKDIDALKSKITQVLYFPTTGKFQTNFVSQTLLEKESMCSFVILTNNIEIAEHSVTNMVIVLREQLKTSVKLTTSIDDSNESNEFHKGRRKDNTPFSRRKTKEELVSNEAHENKKSPGVKDTNSTMCQTTRADDTNKSIDQNQLNHQDVSKFSGDKTQKHNGNINEGHKNKKSSQKTEHQKPKMCPQIVQLSLQKQFTKPEDFFSYIESFINDYTNINTFVVPHESIVLSKTSNCIIHLNSKADNNRLNIAISKFQKDEKLEIKSRVINTEANEANKNPSLPQIEKDKKSTLSVTPESKAIIDQISQTPKYKSQQMNANSNDEEMNRKTPHNAEHEKPDINPVSRTDKNDSNDQNKTIKDKNSQSSTDKTQGNNANFNKEHEKKKFPELGEYKKPKMCPRSVELSLQKYFTKSEEFLSYLKSFIDNKTDINTFVIPHESIILTKTSSRCIIHLKSKADNNRLNKAIFKFDKDKKLEMKSRVISIDTNEANENQKSVQIEEDKKSTMSVSPEIKARIDQISQTPKDTSQKLNADSNEAEENRKTPDNGEHEKPNICHVSRADNKQNSNDQNEKRLHENTQVSRNKIQKNNVNSNEGRENNKSSQNLEHNNHIMSPVIVQIYVQKQFTKNEEFLSYLESFVDNYTNINKFMVHHESIILSKTSSRCIIHMQTKADLKRMTKAISKFHRDEKIQIRSHLIETELNEENVINAWKTKIENILQKMEEKKNIVLEKHGNKISSFESQVEKLNANSETNDAKKNAAEDKLVESCKQRIEFVCKCKSIYKQIQDIKQSITKKRELQKAQHDFGIECQRLMNALPIYARREDIISHVKSNQVSIILGETGSGKSTQIAQYLYEGGHTGNGLIVCTQPRKVAAVQLADRVAQEMMGSTGDLVGVKTGNRRRINDNTKIVFMTDHSLLNECLDDRNFQKYSCIIVDEAHERSIYTDILLGMIKACLGKRPDLRVVITSATIDPQVFIDYFNCPDEIRVSGRMFPVEVFYMDSSDDFENYETKAVSKAAEIHMNEPEGDILVFLTSAIEIQRCCEEFCKKFKNRTDFKCLPLHGQLLPEEQRKVFSKLDHGVRKVVFATNCAETSITIDGIKYVVDTGVSKEMRYDAKKNLNILGIHMISQSSANQRKGRAGRTASGKCFRLFSEEGYEAMTAINQPEILRVHLGQAILKIAELGVKIREYDFVEAPSDSAMLAAIETLEFLRAIVDENITDTGRWISKLPFDPKLGHLVYEAMKANLLYDAIVLASVVSNGSGIFYRGLTETEAQVSSRSKAQFGLESGDIFTWFTVYKIWETKPGKEKYKWCQSNCINYKSMNYIKTCIGEVTALFPIEMNIDVMKQYSKNEKCMAVLSKLMFRAYGLSLCHFMGHNRAGYFTLLSERQVHLHPSSTLAAQNLQPEWLVFVDLVKTSREFIKGVLAVEEEWIQEAIDEGHLDVSISNAKDQTLSVLHKEEVGVSVFWAVVGPRYSNLKVMEEMCENHGMKHTIVEADRDLGTLSIYSSSPKVHPEVVKKLNDIKSEVICKLQIEESELQMFQNESNDFPNIRAVLGSGACVRQVLMPHQTTEVLIRKVGDATKEDILLKFSAFGNILEIISFKSNDPWGFIRYRSVEEAVIAAERTKEDEIISGSLRLRKGSTVTNNVFQAKVSWLRRPVKGDGMAFIKCDPMDKPELIGQTIHINGNYQKIGISNPKKGCNAKLDDDLSRDLVVFKIGKTATEEMVRDSIMHHVLFHREVEIDITILRENVPIPSREKLQGMKSILKSVIDPKNKEDFTVSILPPRLNSLYYTAFLYFKDPVRGLHVCRRRDQRASMNSQRVTITASLRTRILVPGKIKDVFKKQMDELFPCMERDLGVAFEWGKLNENHAITIKCEDPEGIVKARECITKELKGDTIDCNIATLCQCLLTPAGQDYLKKTQKATGCVIMADTRTKMIHMYGKASQVSATQIEFNKYLTENESKCEQIFKLKGLGKPPGLMKALMNKFGPLLDGLVDEYKLSTVSLDWKAHTLKCSGSESVLERLQDYIELLEAILFQAKHSGTCSKEKSLPECVVCLVDVESKDLLYRLETCGHSYCLPCLRHQWVVCVQNKQFPLTCAEEQCGKELAWKDVRFVLSKKWITEEKLIHSSLNFLHSTQPDRYRFCPTPNCPVVYEVTLDKSGCEFNCAVCFASTCSSCHVAFHTGVSCKMAKSGTNAESYLDEWSRKDPEKRKICPGCKSPIEKVEGCNKMRCGSCHTIFCWVCREVFRDEDRCYKHLMREHGGTI